ncbi:hypothetical protein G3T18_23975 [Oscillatoria salina IIICB1]|nr:hypothetical protein [Oscillatoria salina IIICB1]
MEGIISPDWTLSQIPVKTEDFTQFIFTNGIRVILRPNIVTFAEPLKSFLIEKVKVISLVFNYIKNPSVFPSYKILFNIRSYVAFNSSNKSLPSQYISSLLKPGKWLEYGEEEVRATLNFVYHLEPVQLTINIKEAELQLPNAIIIPSVLFSGKYLFNLKESSVKKHFHNLKTATSYWERSIENYRLIVEEVFIRVP